MNTIILILVIIVGIILLSRFIIVENDRVRSHKKLLENMKKHDEKVNKEINSISPLFNGMTGIEVKRMMDKELKTKLKTK